jgi:hypothetical protein
MKYPLYLTFLAHHFFPFSVECLLASPSRSRYGGARPGKAVITYRKAMSFLAALAKEQRTRRIAINFFLSVVCPHRPKYNFESFLSPWLVSHKPFILYLTKTYLVNLFKKDNLQYPLLFRLVRTEQGSRIKI